MIKDGVEATIPEGTVVEAHNWDELQGLGLVFITNSFYPAWGAVLDDGLYHYGPDSEPDVMESILRWEVSDANLFKGDPLLGDPGRPTPSNESLGFYIIPPSPDWTNHWEREIYDEHPGIAGSGLEKYFSLVGPHYGTVPRWQVWQVFGFEGRYRCWGPDTTWETKFEGTIDEVVAHIRTWDAEHGND